MEKAESEGAANAARSPALRDATWALGQLRHLYAQMVGGGVHFPSEAARGLLGPAIEMLEPLLDKARALEAQLDGLAKTSNAMLAGRCRCGDRQIGPTRWIVDGHGPWECATG